MPSPQQPTCRPFSWNLRGFVGATLCQGRSLTGSEGARVRLTSRVCGGMGRVAPVWDAGGTVAVAPKAAASV
jgi:hypothetical protein